ncbi:MAG: hypothetical protein ABSD67_22395 [Terracidiphilus sp.]
MIPILIVVMLFLSTTRVILGTQAIPKPDSAMNVTVIGHQFWWEYRYPQLGVMTANELHIPRRSHATWWLFGIDGKAFRYSVAD